MSALIDEQPSQAWPPTGPLAVVGSSVFISGFFLLATARRDLPLETYALVLAGAGAIALPLLGFTWLVAWSEAIVGRAWAGGLRRLGAIERGAAGVTLRALRYAGILWLANGGALWVAALVGAA